MATKIQGMQGLTAGELNFELQRGAKFVMYQYCISVLVMTFRRSSDIYFLRAGQNAVVKGLPFTLVTLVLGWWGFPWGPIWSVTTMYTNFRGGKDVTNEVIASLNAPLPTAAPASAATPAPPPARS